MAVPEQIAPILSQVSPVVADINLVTPNIRQVLGDVSSAAESQIAIEIAVILPQVGAVVLVPLGVWLILGNLLLAAGLLVLMLFLPRKIYRWLRQRLVLKIQAQLPDGLMMMASSMRAGLGFGPAMESLAKDIDPPLTEEFSLILREQRMGVKPDEALEHFNVRVPIAGQFHVLNQWRY